MGLIITTTLINHNLCKFSQFWCHTFEQPIWDMNLNCTVTYHTFICLSCTLEIYVNTRYGWQNCSSKGSYKKIWYCTDHYQHSSKLLLFMSMGVRPCLWTAVTNGPIVHPRDLMSMEPWWNVLTGKNWRTGRKTCPSATLSTTYTMWTNLGVNLALWGETSK
jgi:hypothetical protein